MARLPLAHAGALVGDGVSLTTMSLSPTDIILIIGALSLAAVNVITALKVKAIEHSVNSAASAAVAKIDALNATVAALTKSLADEQQTAKLLAERAASVKGTP